MSSDPFSPDYNPSEEVIVISRGMCKDCLNIVNGDLIHKVLNILNGRRLICLIIHGSKLYGLDTPQSDLDVKGVYLPSRMEIFLGNIMETLKYTTGNDNSKNTKDDIDIELYSIHHLFKMLKVGDTTAISMLNAPFDKICVQTECWNTIVSNHKMFYSKDMQGLLGYIKTQTGKYCEKGNRLNAAKLAIEFLNKYDDEVRLVDIWNDIPTGDHMEIIESQFDDSPNQLFWEVCNRKIQDTSSVAYAVSVISSVVKSYGKRAKKAAEENGFNDWKAISHAFRVASELSDLYEFGKIRYPLEDFERIKLIKSGKLDFKTEVLPELNKIMDRVSESAIKSNLPDKLDINKVDVFLYSLLCKEI